MQTEVTLYKVPGGHVMLPIFHHAGVLQGETHTNVNVQNTSALKKAKQEKPFATLLPFMHLFAISPAVDTLQATRDFWHCT